MKHAHLLSCSLLTAVMTTGACLPDATESEGRGGRGRDDDDDGDGGDAKTPVKPATTARAAPCIAVPILSVSLSETVDVAFST